MRSILIVEDNKNIRKALSLFLKFKGLNCIEADNGKTGWECFLMSKPDIVLLDFRMPHLNGIELLELIRGKDQNIPVILMSADREIKSKCENAKVERILAKPFSLMELYSLIQSSIKKSNY